MRRVAPWLFGESRELAEICMRVDGDEGLPSGLDSKSNN